MDLPLANFSENPDRSLREQKRNTAALKDLGRATNNDVEFDEDDDDTPDDWEEREDEAEDEIISISKVEVLKPKARHREENCLNIQNDSDFWYLLSKYIRPSDLGKFALICKASYYTVATLGFWRKFYARHFDPVIHYDLPERFQPECMSRPKGIRAEVIKMLHQTHQPFLERQSRDSSIWPDPHGLTGRTCSLQTSNRIGKRSCYHYFRLTESPRSKSLLPVARLEDEDEDEEEEEEDIGDKKKTRKLLADLSDIYYNPEEGSKVLQVSAVNWSSIPPVMGQKLMSVSLSVSHGMRYHKLKLTFGSHTATTRTSLDQQESSQVRIINSVTTTTTTTTSSCRSSSTVSVVSRSSTGGSLSIRELRSLSPSTLKLRICSGYDDLD